MKTKIFRNDQIVGRFLPSSIFGTRPVCQILLLNVAIQPALVLPPCLGLGIPTWILQDRDGADFLGGSSESKGAEEGSARIEGS